MAVFNFTSAREYYGPSLAPTDPNQQIWTSRDPTPFYQEAHPTSNLAALGLGIVGGAAAGFLPTPGGGRVWDYYTRGLRAVEEYSPGAVLRTFQLSAFTSQFTSRARRGFEVHGPTLRSNTRYADYLSRLIGETLPSGETTLQKLYREGVHLRRGKLFFGGGDLALKHASAIFTSEAPSHITEGLTTLQKRLLSTSTHLGSAYSAHIGAGTAASSFGLIDEIAGESFHQQIIGSRSGLGYAGRMASAWGGSLVSRFNRLLRAPVEVPGLRALFNKWPLNRVRLHVNEGSGLQMLGRLGAKYGLGLTTIGLGYSYLDYLADQSSLTEGTVFEEGITTGLATVGVRASLTASRLAEATGFHSYREAQESIAPGSTELSSVLAFPLMGALGATTTEYLVKTGKMVSAQRAGMSAATARVKAIADMQKFNRGTFLGRGGLALTEASSSLYTSDNIIGSLMRKVATPTSEGRLSYKLLGELSPMKIAGVVGAGIGLAFAAPFIPGALIPSTRPEELERIYSGEQEVPIRKGRWWEFGRTPFEGNRIMYFRPHWYARMRIDAREKGIYGDELSPIDRWMKKEFTYELEKEHYYERPYPITGTAFEDIPLIGPLLAGTIGRLIKPPRLMHTEEWVGPAGEVRDSNLRYGEKVLDELGEQPAGQPISPYGAKGIIGEQAYRFTEMIGLPGFAMTSIKEAVTGTPDLFDQFSQLESSRRMFGAERHYWDLEIGGGLGTTEIVRRLYPHRRRQIPLVNSIRNLMPDWLPGAAEKSPDFLHGDPYTKVPEGELRLPGRGYEARYPELEGVAPEDYPTIHKYRILSDVAPYSDAFKQVLQEVRVARKLKSWTEYEENIYQTSREQLQERKQKIVFEEYQHLSPTGGLFDKPSRWGEDSISELITTLNRQYTEQKETERGSLFDRLYGGFWELISHNAETAIDQLTPISPAAKLINARTPVEHYERLQVYGTENAFWQHPWRDFLRPFTNLTARSFGWEGTPGHIQDRRELEEYFDVLEYVKYSRLSNLARTVNDRDSYKEFESKKNETLFGINPFTYNYRSIFRALPRRERDYFNAFAEAETEEQRREILKLVPDNEKALYVARWKLAYGQEIKAAQKAGILTENQLEEAQVELDKIRAESQAEGFPTSDELYAEYWATRFPGEDYGDWYRRTHLLPDVELPGPDWVGWHPSVDLQDIKLKVVQELGESMHDYDLWPNQAQRIENRPFISQEAIEPILAPQELSDSERINNVNRLLAIHEMRGDTFFSTSWLGEGSTSIMVEQEPDISDTLSRLRNG